MSELGKMRSIVLDDLFGSERRAASMLMLQVCVQSYRRVLPSAEPKLQFVLLAGAACYPLCLKSHLSFFFFPVQGGWNLLRRQLLSNTKQSIAAANCVAIDVFRNVFSYRTTAVLCFCNS